MNVWSVHTATPGNVAGAECASQHKVIVSCFSSCEMHYQQKNHYMNDSCLAGIWHYPQQTLCQSWWGWEWRQLCPCCLLTWPAVSQPAASALQTFTLHVPASWLRAYNVLLKSSVGCANCTHIRLWVCCSTSKDFFWLLSSRSLRNFTDSASNSSWSISISESFSATSILGSSEYRYCGQWSAENQGNPLYLK